MSQIQKGTSQNHVLCKGITTSSESFSKPGTKMVNPEPCKELKRRPHLFMAGIVPYAPKRSRCGAVQIRKVPHEPSARIARVKAPSLRRRANLESARRTLCSDPARPSALAVAPCKFVKCAMNPLRGLRVSKRPRCDSVRIWKVPGEPSSR